MLGLHQSSLDPLRLARYLLHPSLSNALLAPRLVCSLPIALVTVAGFVLLKVAKSAVRGLVRFTTPSGGRSHETI